MSYQVLARKWRPQQFEQMVGQRHVLKALVNALDNGRLHHAYLFTGTRGVGKTTLARLFAKSLNCEQGVSSTPCGVCGACVELAENRFVDLIEVDAASRTKVEDTRELLDNVQYAPTRGRYKVYLIDEVHMLSNHSFNALLKTLEEPPPHVKFLLATTDPQKLPVTVLSRCLQFNLKSMTPEMVVEHLRDVLRGEQIKFEEGALLHLGKAAQGSMRDALSLTDQAVAFGQGQVRESEVAEMLGTVDTRKIVALIQALCAQNANDLLARVRDLAEFSPDWQHMMADVLAVLHQMTVLQLAPEYDVAAHGAELKALSGAVAPEDLQLYYQLGLQAHKDLAAAPEGRQGFEMALLRMLAFTPDFKRVPKGRLPSSDNGTATMEAAPASTGPAPDAAEHSPESNAPASDALAVSETAVEEAVEPMQEQPEFERSQPAESAPVPREQPDSAPDTEPASLATAGPDEPVAKPANDEVQDDGSVSRSLAELESTAESVPANGEPVMGAVTQKEGAAVTVPEAFTESAEPPWDPEPYAPEAEAEPEATPSALEMLSDLDIATPEEPSAETESLPADSGASVAFHPVTVRALDAVAEDPELLPEHWLALIPALELAGVMANLLRHSQVVSYADGRITLAISPEYRQLYQADYRHQVTAALQALDLPIEDVTVEFSEPGEETLHEQEQRLRREAYRTARAALEQDAVVKVLVRELDGELLADTVEPLSGANP